METKKTSRRYSAKLLLFGEHVLLLGAPALAVPVPAFYGRWKTDRTMPETETPQAKTRRKRLFEFAAALDRAVFKTDALLKDLEAGLYFDSNIPEGYGLGSSGALCAATYDRYALRKTEDLGDLKPILAGMEGFFHGNSSGIDPLTSYVDAPLRIENKTDVQKAVPARWSHAPLVFLIDTRLPRQTGPLVRWFLEQSKTPDFLQLLDNEYFLMHRQMLDAWLAADASAFWPALRGVSRFQLERLPPMIPAPFRKFWEESLAQTEFSLKICGAGGGGFILGFARAPEAAQWVSEQFSIIFPFDAP
jgi:mevalonate kinase